MTDASTSKKRKRDDELARSGVAGARKPPLQVEAQRGSRRCVSVPSLKSMVMDKWSRLPLPDRIRCVAFIPDGPLLDDMVDRIRDEQKQQQRALLELQRAAAAIHPNHFIGLCENAPDVQCPECDMEVECNEEQLATDEVERRLKRCHTTLSFAVAQIASYLK
jgi:hypothetical protein